MIFRFGEPWQARLRRIQQWHRWFAWHPVRITGTRQIAWLQTVERCAVFEYSGMAYAYRAALKVRHE